MKILTTTSRVLLGLILKVFGLNGFLHFIPLPEGAVGQLLQALVASHYLAATLATASIGGTFLVINRQVALATALVSPVIGNIVLVHLFSRPAGLPIALLIALLWLAVFTSVRLPLEEFFAHAWKQTAQLFSSGHIAPETK
jgi:hypothetical protein